MNSDDNKVEVLYGYAALRPDLSVVFLPETREEKRARYWRIFKYYAARIPALLIVLIGIAYICAMAGAPVYVPMLLGYAAYLWVFK